MSPLFFKIGTIAETAMAGSREGPSNAPWFMNKSEKYQIKYLHFLQNVEIPKPICHDKYKQRYT